jgi:hypothetical protein
LAVGRRDDAPRDACAGSRGLGEDLAIAKLGIARVELEATRRQGGGGAHICAHRHRAAQRDVVEREQRVCERQVDGDEVGIRRRPLHGHGAPEAPLDDGAFTQVGARRCERQVGQLDRDVEVAGERRGAVRLYAAAAREHERGVQVDRCIQRLAPGGNVDVAQLPGHRRLHGPILEHDAGVPQRYLTQRDRHGATLFRLFRGCRVPCGRLLRYGRLLPIHPASRGNGQLETLGRAHQADPRTLDDQRIDHDGAGEQRQERHPEGDLAGLEQGRGFRGGARHAGLDHLQRRRQQPDFEIPVAQLTPQGVVGGGLDPRAHGLALHDARKQDRQGTERDHDDGGERHREADQDLHRQSSPSSRERRISRTADGSAFPCVRCITRPIRKFITFFSPLR